MSERRLPVLGSADGWDGAAHGRWQEGGAALAHSSAGISGVVDLLGNASQARVMDVDGTTNIISPRTVVPGVFHTVKGGGDHWMATRVWGVPFKMQGVDEGGKWVYQWKTSIGDKYESAAALAKDLDVAGAVDC